jgi:hypothetical protein
VPLQSLASALSITAACKVQKPSSVQAEPMTHRCGRHLLQLLRVEGSTAAMYAAACVEVLG